MSPIDLFKNYLHSRGLCAKKTLKKHLHKKMYIWIYSENYSLTSGNNQPNMAWDAIKINQSIDTDFNFFCIDFNIFFYCELYWFCMTRNKRYPSKLYIYVCSHTHTNTHLKIDYIKFINGFVHILKCFIVILSYLLYNVIILLVLQLFENLPWLEFIDFNWFNKEQAVLIFFLIIHLFECY